MDKNEKERLAKYGKLVWDFANSKTTDDILTSFFENLQSAFNFSSDFKEKALKQYKTKQMTIGSLSDKEHDLFEMLLDRNEIFESCDAILNPNYYHLEKYDSINFVFTIEERIWNQGDEDYGYTDKTYIIQEKEIETFIDKASFQYPEEWDDLKKSLKALIELCRHIEDIKSESTNRYAEIEKMAEGYPVISNMHHYLDETQKNLKLILLQITEADSTFGSKGFKNILSRYNSIQKIQYIVNEDQCKLVQIAPFIEGSFLEADVEDWHISVAGRIFNAPISYCLVEFLKNPDYCGKERISVCQNCKCIFSKSRLNGQQKYCPVCSRKNKMTPEEKAEYMKGYRANPARKKAIAKQKREERIRHLMADAGKTRKQAEIIIDNEM